MASAFSRRLARSGTNLLRSKCLQMSTSSQHILKSPLPDVEEPFKGNFINYLFKDIQKNLDKEAVRCSVTGKSYKYGELWDKMSRFAGLLQKLGVQKGDVVALHGPNFPDYAIVFFGTMFTGATLSPVSCTNTPDEIARHLSDCGAKVVVGHPLLEAPLNDALEVYGKHTHYLMMGPSANPKAINMMQALEDSSIPFLDPVELTGDETVVLPYSSGTTGPPKGVVQTHHAFATFMKLITHPYFYSQGQDPNIQDQFLGLMPFYHIYGMNIMAVSFFHGMRLVTAPKFDAPTFIQTISDHKIDRLHIVPPILNYMVQSPAATPGALSCIRGIIIAAAPVAPSMAHAFKQKMNRDLVFQECFGMTETYVTHQTPIEAEKLGTSGQILPNCQSKLIDSETGNTLPAYTKGELLVKTPGMMKEYYNNPSATAETIDENGWLHTGDIAVYDDEGYFKIVDRTKELIKVKGLQVSPSELEDVIRAHPKIADIGIIGVPHERLGEAPRAFVVVKESMGHEELHQYLATRLAAHKQLAGGITIVDALPKNATGKLLRKDLQKMALEG